MDFLNKASKQFTDLFQSMTPGGRITAGLLLAVIVISLAYLVQFQSAGGSDMLFGGREFSQAELGNMEAAFGKAGLEDYKIEGFRIRVPQGPKAVYLAALADEGALPDEFDTTMEKAFGNGFFAVPRAVQEAKLKAAKENNLSLMIRRMRGIEDARVQFETEKKGGLRSTTETRAVAAIKPQGNNELDEKQIRAIRNTVVAGVAGLKSENVTVTDLNANAAYPGNSNGAIPGVEDSVYLSHKKFYENHYKQKITEQLRNYPGIVVGVEAELDTVLSHEQFSRNIDPKTVPLEVAESSSNETTTNSQKGGAPGVTPNVGGANNPAVVSNAGGSGSTIEKIDSKQRSAFGHTTYRKSMVPLVLKRVTTSIGVPRSYYVKLWKQRNPTPAGEEAKEPEEADIVALEGDTERKIEKVVFTLLPKRVQGEDPWSHIQIVRDDDLPMDPILPPSITDTASTWLAGNWQTLGMGLFGAFSLVMLRGMVRSTDTGPNSPTVGEATPQLQGSESGEPVDDESEEGDARHLKFETSGPNLRSELSQLVKDDPDAAANVLKNWIGDAA